jgi:hypothetical protein
MGALDEGAQSQARPATLKQTKPKINLNLYSFRKMSTLEKTRKTFLSNVSTREKVWESFK